jgi:hypothetical protein
VRKIFLAVSIALLWSASAFAEQRVIIVNWTAASNGTVGDVSITASEHAFLSGYGFYLYSIETDPGTPAPTDNYDVKVLNARGRDILGAKGDNRDETTTEEAFPAGGSQSLQSTTDLPLTLNITGNSVNGAKGSVKLVFATTPIPEASSVTTGEINLDNTALEGKVDATNTRIGEVQASPTANTLLGRIKSLEDGQTAIEGKIDDLATELAQKTEPTNAQLVNNTTAANLIGRFHLFDSAGNGITSEARGSTRPLDVQLRDASGNQITSFGITGTPSFNIAQYLGSAIGASNALHVQPGTGAVFGISASALPLPTGAATETTLAAVEDALDTAINTPLSSTTDSVTVALPSGASPHSRITLASANQVNVKSSAGTLYSIYVFNPTAVKQYLLLFDKATAPDQSACSANSDCPVLVFPIPTMADTNGDGIAPPLPVMGFNFANGIGYSVIGAACGEVATCVNETAAEAGLTVTLGYK